MSNFRASRWHADASLSVQDRGQCIVDHQKKIHLSGARLFCRRDEYQKPHLPCECRNQEMDCNQHEFWFINSCEELSKHFPCEQGCAVELGNDVPNYVNDASLGSHQTCLVNQKQPKCEAANPSTLRLCPCVPQQ